LVDTGHNGSLEIVTALVRKADYTELKKSGVPVPHQVAMALWQYLRLIEETKLIPGAIDSKLLNSSVTTFSCALPRDLCDRIRSFPGRFDLHVLEAVRLWLR